MNIAVKPEKINVEAPLAGKLSLVTGSTSGIGRGIARALAAAGSDIVLNGFGKPDDIAQAQANIASDFKVRVAYFKADMSKPLAIREMIEGVLQSSGRLDILVNNAGIQHVATQSIERRRVKAEAKRPQEQRQVVLVFQGGGALGAYQAGVYQALHESGIEPDWIIGTSIGAINASLIAGNEPDNRVERLEEFWRSVP
jgi:NAD(P)-dependent dehydrogenase (short-subunit alcohol dehydrogenase family)